jgi:hypothetical protein
MDSVFMLWHSHDVDGETDEKLIGVYKTREDAEGALRRVKDQPGFRETPEGFEICENVLGRDGWTEGYITQAEAMRDVKE